MIAETTDIKFACSQCGQRIVVERAAAGLTANCPICSGALTVPVFGPEQEPHHPGAASQRDFHSFSDPALDQTREELFDLSVDHGRLQRDLDGANQEIERLRALFKKAVDECERTAANATHAQAEIKSFQTDRQQLKSELAQAKQRATAAENQMAEWAAALTLATEEKEAAEYARQEAFAESVERAEVVERELTEKGRELAARQAEYDEILQSLAGAQSELTLLRTEWTGLQRELETAQQLLSEAGDQGTRLESEKQELWSRLEAATTETQHLREQAETLRRDLNGTDLGVEVLDLRSRLRDLTEDRAHIAETLAEQRTANRALEATEKTLRSDLEESRSLHEAAERKASANSELQLNKDNEVLRGIVARQNTTLGVYYSEVRRLRRGRFALRLVYGLFALGLLGLVFFAVSIFSHQGVGEWISQLLQ